MAGSDAGAAGSAPAVSTSDLKALVNELQNDADRRKLIAAIQALIAARDLQNGTQGQSQAATPDVPANSGETAIAAASEGIRNASDALVGAAEVLLDLPRIWNWLQRQAGDRETRGLVAGTLLRLIAVLAGALAAERAAFLMLGQRRRPAAEGTLEPTWPRLILFLGGILRDLLSLVAFTATAFILLPFTHPSDAIRPVLLVLLFATAALRGLLAIGRGLLTPKEGGRPLGIGPETGSYWYVWLRRFAVLLIGGYGATDAAFLLGLPPAGLGLLLKAIGFAVAALVVVLILQNREAVRDWIHGHPGTEQQGSFQVLRHRTAELWHVAALIYVAAILGVWVLDIPGGFAFILRASALSAAAIAAARVLADLTEKLLRRFFSIGRDLHLRFPGLEERAGRYLPVLTLSLRVGLYGAAGLMVLQAWGLESFAWLETDIGRRIVSDLATLLITALLAVLIWEATSIAIEVYLARGVPRGPHRPRRARAETLLPLLRRTVAIVLIVFVALIALSAIGLDIGPLLAGAGVVGIAIGFGAQTFVKDLINGLHLLFEDTFAVGDVVAIGPDAGTVEAISMRTVRLRDGGGALRTIPFSEITKVTNMTRDYAYAVFDVPIDFREDVGRAVALLEAIGAELAADPELAPDILAAMDKPVLSRFADYAIILHCQIRTLPGRQWDVQNEFNRRLKSRFDVLGVVMPYPARRVLVEDLTEASQRSAVARRFGDEPRDEQEAARSRTASQGSPERPLPARDQDLARRLS